MPFLIHQSINLFNTSIEHADKFESNPMNIKYFLECMQLDEEDFGKSRKC
jgi:hypothetical protein